MPITVPNHVLSLERVRLSDFFLMFSRFEFALKAAGYAKAGKWGAEVDWKKFADDIAPELLPLNQQALQDAVSYLQASPPKQQKYENGGLTWEPRQAPASYSKMRALLFHVQGVRNNLVHGGKFLDRETPDPNRDIKLLEAAECVVSECLHLRPSVHYAFNN